MCIILVNKMCIIHLNGRRLQGLLHGGEKALEATSIREAKSVEVEKHRLHSSFVKLLIQSDSRVTNVTVKKSV